MINDFKACRFDPALLRCGAEGSSAAPARQRASPPSRSKG